MHHGLSAAQAASLLKKNGFNEIPEKRSNLLEKVFHKLLSPISLMLVLASFLSFTLHKTFDGYFILMLLVLNLAITLWQEKKADDAIEKLNSNLDQKIKVLRDDQWQYVSSRNLVAGDVVQLASGEVLPADGTLIEAAHVSINESALTGESLPKDKDSGADVFSGSFITSGIATVRLTATGANTKFGKTIFSMDRILKKSLMEKDIISISKFLTFLSLAAIFILSFVFVIKHAPFFELLTLDLSLVIAGIPISLPTVMTLIIEFGVINLAKKNVIVRRLSALEDLANVNFLLTDKTGTLTQNKIVVQDVYAYDGFTHNDVITYTAVLASQESDNPIDSAILAKLKSLHLNLPEFEKVDFIPADSERKRSTLIINKRKRKETITVGAPQIVADLCSLDHDLRVKFDREVSTLAESGYRTLAVATVTGDKEKNMKIVGLIALSDILRPDAKSAIQFLKENSIGVAMVTGDNRAIASQISKQLGLDDGKVVTKEELDKIQWDAVSSQFYKQTGSFAEILPEDKLLLVQKAKRFFIVAADGDGVNDLPAVTAAHVGFAVKNAVTALKSAADIVLLSEGISVIRDAIIESRKIFERIYTYSLYRISESLRLIVTITVLGIIYGVYPLTALQIIIIALLNDIPIISLAFDKVKLLHRPAKIQVKERFALSSLFGIVGVINSLLLFLIMKNVLNLDWGIIQTIYFLKLTVSGHMLIYVAHTKLRWWKFFPSKEVIWATTLTQLIATLFALTGFLMPGKLTFGQIIFVWLWAFFWMQISELAKIFQQKFISRK